MTVQKSGPDLSVVSSQADGDDKPESKDSSPAASSEKAVTNPASENLATPTASKPPAEAESSTVDKPVPTNSAPSGESASSGASAAKSAPEAPADMQADTKAEGRREARVDEPPPPSGDTPSSSPPTRIGVPYWIVAALVLFGVVLFAGQVKRGGDLESRVTSLTAELDAANGQLRAAQDSVAAYDSYTGQLRDGIAALVSQATALQALSVQAPLGDEAAASTTDEATATPSIVEETADTEAGGAIADAEAAAADADTATAEPAADEIKGAADEESQGESAASPE